MSLYTHISLHKCNVQAEKKYIADPWWLIIIKWVKADGTTYHEIAIEIKCNGWTVMYGG